MSRILSVLVLPAVVLVLLVVSPDALSQEDLSQPDPSQEDAESESAEAAAASTATAGDAERGRYLVEGVAMCGQCHTPRTAGGELQMDQWLKGAPIPVTTPQGYDTWAYKAPRIAGLPQHTDEEFVTLMTTGINRDGKETLSPMPQFRMTEDDAQAIAAYLRSLE